MKQFQIQCQNNYQVQENNSTEFKQFFLQIKVLNYLFTTTITSKIIKTKTLQKKNQYFQLLCKVPNQAPQSILSFEIVDDLNLKIDFNLNYVYLLVKELLELSRNELSEEIIIDCFLLSCFMYCEDKPWFKVLN